MMQTAVKCHQLQTLRYMPFIFIERQARSKPEQACRECCTYCKHEKASSYRSENNSMVGRTYPSLSFSRLAIDLVKPVKQVSKKRVFPGGRLIRWKIITNSALNLKKMEALVGS